MREAVITGLGAISAHGLSVSALWSDLKEGVSAIRPLASPYDSTKIKIGAMVPDYTPEDHFESDALSYLDRFSQYAVIAAKAAVADAGLSESQITGAAAIIGSGCGGKETDELTYDRLYRQGMQRAHPMTIPRGMPSAAASAVSSHIGTKGPAMLVSSACASGAHAIIQGAIMIQTGIVDVAIVGASDAPFTNGLLKSWEALRVTTDDTCRPFSADRSGIVLGEGAGIVVLETAEHAAQREAEVYATIAGFGMTADAGHITRPDLDGITRALSNALAMAHMDPGQIDHINAHGTGTIANDSTESTAINQLFGQGEGAPVVSSTKSMHGHALGAASALEFIATSLAVKHNIVPPTANVTSTAPDCDINLICGNSVDTEIKAAMSNSFAFGGLNACVVITK